MDNHVDSDPMNGITHFVVRRASASATLTLRSDFSDLEPNLSPSTVDTRLLEYVSDVDRNLMCPICRCPFIDPLRLSCDHTYCKLCLKRSWYNQTSSLKTCPTCRKAASELDALPIPRFLLHMIDDLMVKCPKSASGCDKRLKRSDVQSHVDNYCHYTDMPCPSKDCRQKTPRRYLTNNCRHVTATCEHCNLQMPELELEGHVERLCAVKRTTCEFCQTSVSSLDWTEHVSQCTQATVSCSAKSIGCSHLSNKQEMNIHEQSCPLVAILPYMLSLTSRMEDQEATSATLRRKNVLLEESFAALQNLLAEPATASSEPTSGNPPSQVPSQVPSQRSPGSSHISEAAPFDSATHHMLSLHESLREELDRVSAAISEVDGRTSMTILNETMRIREDLTHVNAVISSMRMQLQWLTSARLQAQPRGPAGPSTVSAIGARGQINSSNDGGPSQPVRRLSDSARQDTKL